MNDTPRTMIYGANGYTGRLIARRAVERGLQPTLAGRNHEAVTALAAELDCPAVSFSLQQSSQIAEYLKGFAAVMHCAGPFSQTARQMMDACLATGTDYLDITGEIDVILCGGQPERAGQGGRRGADAGRGIRRGAQRLPGGAAGRQAARGHACCNWRLPAPAA